MATEVLSQREVVGMFCQDGYDIVNKRWESSIEIPLLDWRHDKTGQIQVRIRDLATRYGAHVARLISDLMASGESTACYDGQYFFDTDHSEGDSGTQSNDLSVDISALPVGTHGSTTAPSVSEAAEVIMQGVAQILGFLDDQGEPMNEEARDFRVIVPTPLWRQFAAAAASQTIDQGDTNPLAIGSMDGYRISVHMNARLSWTTKVAVFRADGNVKPFIYQEDGGGVNSKILGPDSEYATINDSCLVTTDAINAAGYGYWQHACLLTMA